MSKRWIGCPIEVDYFGEDRKSGKTERKLASAKDRSKYKKTDQRKQLKQSLDTKTTQAGEKGRVLSITSQGVSVDVNGEIFLCTLRGILKKDKSQAKNLVIVGDFVQIERLATNEGAILYVEPRRSVLSRAETLSRRKEQLIAANIDQVIIIVSVVSPTLKPSLVDRYIIATQKGGMEPIIVINKLDLLTNPNEDIEVRKKEASLLQEMLKAYKAANVPIIPVSTITGEGLNDLAHIMRDKASVFSGQSGVGKSSLINAITGEALSVGNMVDKTNKGTHTTTTAQLLRLEFGGWCIDTPGIKSFGVWNLDKNEIEHYFPEIFICGHQCHFPDCSHLHEEKCAVKAAVNEGKISHLRYESYLSLMHSIEQDHLRR